MTPKVRDEVILIPNTFQHPNLYVDKLAHLLTPEESVVLTKAVREIIGWQNREKLTRQIALSVFVEGKFREGLPQTEDNRLCHGCGIGRAAIIKALRALDRFGILVKTGKTNDPNGQCYTLQLDANQINWAGLQQRKEERESLNAKRTYKATRKRAIAGSTSDVTSNVGRTETRNVGRTETRNVGRTHGKPQKPNRKPERQLTQHPAIQVFQQEVKKYPHQILWSEIIETVGENPADLELWREVIHGWILTGWKQGNIGGMLDYYRRREIPSTQKKPPNGKVLHTSAEVIYDQWGNQL